MVIFAEQKTLIEKRLNLIRGYIDGPGRRYRIYHGAIHGGFQWKPFGPVYRVPESLERELLEKRKERGYIEETLQNGRTVWVGGIRRFEKEGLLFQSTDTPVIFGHEFIEWIDPVPAPDRSYMEIECESQNAETYIDVNVQTTGFTLEADRACIELTRGMVKILPLPR